MSLQTRIESLVQRLAVEFKTVYGSIGPLGNLATVDKTNLVSAINELRTQIISVASGSIIDDTNPSATATTFSASKITTLLDALKTELLGGADAAFDTLRELQEALQSDSNALAALLAAVDKRIRFDAAQSLTAGEQAQARANIGAVSIDMIGNTDTDFIAVFDAALL